MIIKFDDFKKLNEDGSPSAAPTSFSSIGGSVAVGTSGDAFSTNSTAGMSGIVAAAPIPTQDLISSHNDGKYIGSGDIGQTYGSVNLKYSIKQSTPTKKEKKIKKKSKNIKKFDDLFKETK